MTRILSLPTGEPAPFLGLGVSLDFVKKALRATTAADQEALFEQEIRRLHGYRTFQKCSAISEAIALIGVQQLWDRVGAELGRPLADVKTELDLIIDRRNRIAHEGDIDPAAGFALKYPIDLPTTRAAADTIEAVVRALHVVVVAEVTP